MRCKMENCNKNSSFVLTLPSKTGGLCFGIGICWSGTEQAIFIYRVNIHIETLF